MSEARVWLSVERDRWRPLVPANTHSPLQTEAGAGVWPLLIVLSAVLLNAGLAVVNAHIVPLSANAVIGAEVLVVVAAHVVVLANYRPQMFPWYALIVIIVLFSLERAVVVGQFDPKFLRDALLIPTFVLLGMTTSPRRLTALVVFLHVIVVGGVLFEAFFTQAYSNLFDVKQYYIATRSLDVSDFFNKSSDLFVSATRPGERFFSLIDLHRTSSVLLEPVSLGNYVIIVTAFLCANSKRMSWKVSAFLLMGNFVSLIGCDGRLAAVLSVVIILIAMVATWLPWKSALLYLPLTLVGAVAFVVLAHPDVADNFPGRVAYGIDLLARYDLLDWFGNSDRLVVDAADSGIAYTITTQSVIGLAAFWCFLVLNAKEQTPEQVKYLHAVCIYLALSMLVSYSLFSIKTAALLWFIYGSFQMASRPSPIAPRAARERVASSIHAQLGPRLAW